ncbi:hypothetical protein ATANTOWER_009812 [Ataeniobius toweri]|uniref:Uncharacterized protein n=1 Tax=Ataeniobius toweri TaxID=208326 RepID=A0ABU7A5E2_9TELE|nr:hypothetical protein [Ataeniobius toweri]
MWAKLKFSQSAKNQNQQFNFFSSASFFFSTSRNKHGMRCPRISPPTSSPDQSNIKVINRPKLFFFFWHLLPGRFRAVRMCEGVQTDNAGEIVRLDRETQRKGGTEKNQKRRRTKKKKRFKKTSKQNPRAETGTMRSKGRARKLATSRCNIPFSFFSSQISHFIYL